MISSFKPITQQRKALAQSASILRTILCSPWEYKAKQSDLSRLLSQVEQTHAVARLRSMLADIPRKLDNYATIERECSQAFWHPRHTTSPCPQALNREIQNIIQSALDIIAQINNELSLKPMTQSERYADNLEHGDFAHQILR